MCVARLMSVRVSSAPHHASPFAHTVRLLRVRVSSVPHPSSPFAHSVRPLSVRVSSAPHPSFASPFAHTVRVGQHSLLSDQPLSLSGADAGPTPYDLLLASLGACTGMTLRMYADRKAFPLQAVDVELSHSKAYADDCAGCTAATSDDGDGDNKARKLDRIERLVTLHGPELTADQRMLLLQACDLTLNDRTRLRDMAGTSRSVRLYLPRTVCLLSVFLLPSGGGLVPRAQDARLFDSEGRDQAFSILLTDDKVLHLARARQSLRRALSQGTALPAVMGEDNDDSVPTRLHHACMLHEPPASPTRAGGTLCHSAPLYMEWPI
jgi:uncharacterized OsmC-like protein